MNTVCNEDCLHCTYEDCILDEVTHAAFQNLDDTKKLLSPLTMHQSYNRLFHFAHKEELNAKHQEWWAKNKDEYNAKRRKRYAEHKELRMRVAAWSATYWAAHKEKIKARNAAYYEQHSTSNQPMIFALTPANE